VNSCGTVATVLDFGPSRKLRKEKVEKEGGKKVFISNIFKIIENKIICRLYHTYSAATSRNDRILVVESIHGL
jgi:hypothetical protein